VGGACDATGNQVRVSPKHALGATVTYDLHSDAGLFSFSANDSYKSKSYWDYGDQIANEAHSVVNATIRFAPSRQKWAISLRGRNLTNSTYWTEVLTRAEGFMGTPAEPRAYSANFEMHF
jgi:outer membrane receptor protein involved in Fe transport